MAYKIAVATSDGENINETFGSAEKFIIYEVTDGFYEKSEERFYLEEFDAVKSGCNSSAKCGKSDGCGSGCGGQGGSSAKVELIGDCRAIVCKKIGFHIQKQLERKAISAFDVDCTINEALKKITTYYSRVDRRNKKELSNQV